jgi:hypothetical protein
MNYDPFHDLDPAAWLALDEQARIVAVEQYHRRRKIRLPNATLHATIHTVVENQVALGEQFPAKATLARLMSEGLDRHEAIHAIGSVLSRRMFNALKGKGSGADLNAQYVEELVQLTAESWRKSAP